MNANPFGKDFRISEYEHFRFEMNFDVDKEISAVWFFDLQQTLAQLYLPHRLK